MLTRKLTRKITERLTRPITQAGAGGQSLDSAVRALFANGEQGAWYRLADTATLSQDNTGAAPVTASGQALGRINDKSGNGVNASQATAAARPAYLSPPARMRSDFSNDVLACTLAADGEAWINTPYGHYKAPAHAGAFRLPLNDCTEMLVHPGLSLSQEADLSAYFGTERVPNGVFLSPDTSVTLNCYAPGGYTAAVIRFIGANGVSVDKTWDTADTYTTLDLNATDGLTAPMAVVPLSLGSLYAVFHNNQFTGSLDLSSNTALYAAFSNNQFTGSLDLSFNTALMAAYFHNNQFTGSLDLSANTAMLDAYFNDNQFTGFTGTVSATLGDFDARNNLLTQAAVDAILAAFDAAGRNSGTRILRLGGTGNAAPSAAGITSKDNLLAKGWTVTTN